MIFGISGAELTAIVLIALLLVGPERLPALTKRVMAFIRQFRATWTATKKKMDEDADALIDQSGMRQARDELGSLTDELNGRAHGDTPTAAPQS